jgi:glycosyltransferase involved in cell wall biosynthesis
VTRDTPDLPLVSVVLPVRNEGRYLQGCLDAIAAQDYPRDCLEVVIVDGQSEDDTRQIAEEFARGREAVRVLDNPHRRIAPALNIGFGAARGEIIVRVDGHTLIEPDYVRECVATLRETGADVVGGPRVVHGTRFWGHVIASSLRSPLATPARFHRSVRVSEVDTVFLGAFKRTTLDRVGLFDERFLWNEDYELNYRIRTAGGRVCSSPRVRSTYFSRETLRELVVQYWHYGRGKAMVMRAYPASIAARHLAAPVFVLAVGLGALGLAFGDARPLGALMSAYAVCLAWAAVRAVRSVNVAIVTAAMLALACVHLAWGCGLLGELIRGGVPVRRDGRLSGASHV